MANNKVGLDYFELNCHMDEKVDLIEAEFGLKGFAIVVKLYQSIYSGFGYYCEWTPDISLLWARRLGVSHGGVSGGLDCTPGEGMLPGFPDNLINNVVAASIRRNLFSEELFNKYHILTSHGIQARYVNATARREKVALKKEYLLLSDGKINSNVIIIEDNVNIIEENVIKIAQRRVEKSRVKKRVVVAPSGNDAPNDSGEAKKHPISEFEYRCVDMLIQSCIAVFPNSKVPSTETEKKSWAVEIERMKRLDGRSEADIIEALTYATTDGFWKSNIRSAKKFREKFETLIIQSRASAGRKKNENKFNQFQQNGYDFGQLEKELVEN